MTSSGSSSALAGFRFPREVIAVAVRWYLRYGLSCRDVEELLAERGITVDHVTVYRWVQRFTCCCPSGATWRPGGSSPGRCARARSRPRSPPTGPPRVLDELIPSALHTVERYANNPVETDHGRLKARLRPKHGLKRHRSARILATGHAFVQNSAAATMNSLPKSPPATGSAQHSTSS